MSPTVPIEKKTWLAQRAERPGLLGCFAAGVMLLSCVDDAEVLARKLHPDPAADIHQTSAWQNVQIPRKEQRLQEPLFDEIPREGMVLGGDRFARQPNEASANIPHQADPADREIHQAAS